MPLLSFIDSERRASAARGNQQMQKRRTLNPCRLDVFVLRGFILTSQEKLREIHLKMLAQMNRKYSFIDYLLLRPLQLDWDPKDWAELTLLRFVELSGLKPGMDITPIDTNANNEQIKNIVPMRSEE